MTADSMRTMIASGKSLLNKFTSGRTPRRVVAAGLAGLAVLATVVASISWGVASADNDALVGDPVSDEQMTAITAAARSCPMLTPERIAGQLMAESGLNNRTRKTASGGKGIAGLDDDDWDKWKPWPDARRSDSSANILALAHQMCDFAGQLRIAGVSGDQWRLAVAAFHVGLSAVVEASGMPASAVEYVDQVSGYAAYYGKLKQFGGPGIPASPANDAKGVPAQYVPLIVEAGSVCQRLTPPMVAAQLMALSEFDPNMLGPAGERGIAQFLPEVWDTYGPEGGSAWDPAVAIPAMGAVMCGLISELSSLDGDPYLLALAAYRNGPTAVRQSDRTFDQKTETFLRAVKSLTDLYALDSRLSVPKQDGPTSAPPPSSPTSAPTTEAPPNLPTPPAVKTTAPAAPPATPATTKPTRPAGAKQIYHPRMGLCVSSGTGGDGTRLTLRPCREEPAQWWVVHNDKTIRSRNLCMDIAWGASQDGTPVQVAICSGNPAQHWRINGTAILSVLNGKALDIELDAPNQPLNISGYVPGNTEQIWQLR